MTWSPPRSRSGRPSSRSSTGRPRRSGSRSSSCSPRGTCSSRTCPAWARRCSPRRWRGPSTARCGGSSSPPTCCRATSPGSAPTTRSGASSSSSRGRCSRTSSSATRSTGPRRKPSRRCSSAWKSGTSPSTAPPTSWSAPFMVIATQNPVEMEGTYPLPEAQRDRFTARISIGYPTAAAELEMLDTHGSSSPLDQLKPVATALDVRALIEAVRGVLVAGQVKEYIIALCAATQDRARAAARRLAAGRAAPAARVAGAGRARRAGLRHTRRHPGPGRPGARAPAAADRRGPRGAEAARAGGRAARRADAAAAALSTLVVA